MNTRIKATSFDLTPAISQHVDKRMDKVSKLVESDPTVVCDIELGRTTEHHAKGPVFRAEIHLVGAGKNLYAAKEAEDLYSAIDEVQSEIIRELTSASKKRLSYLRRGGARVKGMVKGLWPWKGNATDNS